jgi:hypothetical protein
MRSILLAAALAAAGAAMAGDLVGRDGDEWVRLTDAPCSSELVLGRLPASAAGEFHAATAQFHGQLFTACWRVMGNAAFLIYEDGDQGVIPLQALKPELGA